MKVIKCICFILLGFSLGNTYAQTQELNQIRNLYKKAGSSLVKYEAFQKAINDVKSQELVFETYRVAADIVYSKFKKTVKEKKYLFKKSVLKLDKIIEENSHFTEAIFIRLTIQQNTPKMLKYRSNIEDDKRYLLTNYNGLKSSHLKKYIQEYILKSKGFTKSEKALIL